VAKDEFVVDPASLESIVIYEDHYFQVDGTETDWILEAVDALDEPRKSVVELIVWGRLSKAETARQLGCSRQHVHTLWADAQQILREALHEMLQED